MTSSTAQHPTETPAPPIFVKDPPRRSGGRTAFIVIGALFAAAGVVIAIAGGALMALFGSDGVLQTGRHDVSTPTAALVSETATIDDVAGAANIVGDTRIRLSAQAAGGKPVFVGVARSADVESYLSGVAVDEVTDFDVDPFTLDRDRRDGSGDARAPGDQDFWVARSDGSDTASINWKVRDGDYRFVVMNADGSADVRTDGRVGVKVPWIGAIGLGILIAGLIAAGIGMLGVALGLRRG
jgi:hypothetical protein